MGVEHIKKFYALADMLLLRFKYDRGSAQCIGMLRWNPPWGGQVDLSKSCQFTTSKQGHLHVLVKLPGDLRIYAGCDDLDVHLVFLDASRKRDDNWLTVAEPKSSITDQITLFGDMAVAHYAKTHGSNDWNTVKKPVAAAA